jgi:PKD repeat protein
MLRTLAALSFAAALAAQSPLQSTFVGGLQLTIPPPAAATALFDITVTDPNGIVVHQIDVNSNVAAGNNGTLGVWITGQGGTLVGNEVNAAAWTQVATATRTHTGGRVAFTLPTPFFLAPGNYGMALHHVGVNPIYTNPLTPVPPLPSSYSTAEATLNMVSARMRASQVGNPFSAGGLGNLRHANVALFYVSGSVYCDFAGTPTRGASPLTVQFTSFAVSGNPGGILAYAWDFENDGIVDSGLPNPQFTYVNCGSYTVTLTIFDSVGPTVMSKSNYIQTDIVVPSFTSRLLGANTVQFTDTSVPTPTAWAWDLDGDNVTDSTAQNPTFVYASNCSEVNVTLTTTLACQPSVVLQKRIAVANTADTTFQSGLVITATAAGGVSYFDVDVTNPSGVTVCGMHVNNNVANGSPVSVNVFQKTGTYVGSVENASAWRQVANVATTSRGAGQRTFVPFATPIHLAAGVNGIAVEIVGGSPVYTNLGALTTYTNPDFTITAGMVQAIPIFGPAATSTQFTPRVWNGALHFGTTQTNGAAGYGYIGAGCTGSLGVPGNVSTTLPTLGGAATITVNRLPLDLALLVLGVTRSPLPLDLGVIGMPGCPLHISAEATQTMLGAGNTAITSFPVPNVTALVGVQIFTQALSLDPAANAFGFAISDAAVMLVGQ